MITDATVLDTIPQEGAERAAQVWCFMRDQGPVMAAARAILAYSEWLAGQSCEMRLQIALDTERTVQEIRNAREQWRLKTKEIK